MGGFYGHMDHLYDNPDLKFSTMKEIFQAASNGRLEGTEKTDGQNLFVSYNVTQGKAKAVRNKGELIKGGLTPEELAEKFRGRGAIEKAFVEAFDVFEQAVRSLTIARQIGIFGRDADVFYNSEIQDPRASNVINYDTKNLTIHRVGHVSYNKKTGTIQPVSVGKNASELENSLMSMQKAIASRDFGFQLNAIRKLEGLTDDLALNKAELALDKALQDAGVSDNETVGHYTVKRLMPMIKAHIQLPEDKEKLLLKKMLGHKGVKILDIKRDLPPEQKQIVSDLVANSGRFLQNAIQPIESLVHDFSVEMLRSMQSAFLLDNDTEAARLKKEVDTAIKAIENSGNEDAIEMLQKQMTKLKSAEQVTTAAEGFVFDYDGHTYKFTGNFAPINQILGLFKYGRKGIPAIQKSTEPLEEVDETPNEAEDSPSNVVGLFPGAFKPPHRGHLDVVKHLASKSKKVIILISPKSRQSKETGDVFTLDQALKIWDLYIDAAGLSSKVAAIMSPDNSPVKQAIDFLSNEDDDPAFAQPGDVIILGCSNKPDERGSVDCARFTGIEKYAREGISVVNPMNPKFAKYGFIPVPPVLSASQFRDSVKSGDVDMWLPEEVLANPSYKNKVLEALNVPTGDTEESEDTEKKTLTLESLFSLVESVINEIGEETADSLGDMSDNQGELADLESEMADSNEELAKAREELGKAAQTAAKVHNDRKDMLNQRKGAQEQIAASEQEIAKASEEMQKALAARQKAAETKQKALDVGQKATDQAIKLQDQAITAEETREAAQEKAQGALEQAAKSTEDYSKAREEYESTLDATSDAISSDVETAEKETEDAEEEKREKEEKREEGDEEAAAKEEPALEEISSVAGGAMAFSPSPPDNTIKKRNRKKKEKTNLEELITKEEVYKEVMNLFGA